MSDSKKAALDTETILITLDQIGQTIDIMTNVVGRLRGYITEQVDHQTARDFDSYKDQALVHKESPTRH